MRKWIGKTLAVLGLVLGAFTSASATGPVHYSNIVVVPGIRSLQNVNVGIYQTSGSGVYTVSSATESGSTVTISTSVAHGYLLGSLVVVDQVGNAGYDGIWKITAVPTSTTFTYTDTNYSNLTPSSGGFASESLATLYSLQSEASTIANPLNPDFLGNYGFWIEPGWYVEATYGAGFVAQIRDITPGTGSGGVVTSSTLVQAPNHVFTCGPGQTATESDGQILCTIPQYTPTQGPTSQLSYKDFSSSLFLKIPPMPPGSNVPVSNFAVCMAPATPSYTCTLTLPHPSVAGEHYTFWQVASTQAGGNPPAISDAAGDTFTNGSLVLGTSGIGYVVGASVTAGTTSFTCTSNSSVQSGAGECFAIGVLNFGGYDLGAGNQSTATTDPVSTTASITTVHTQDLILALAGQGSDWPCYGQNTTMTGANVLMGGPNLNSSSGGLGGHGPSYGATAIVGAGTVGSYSVTLSTSDITGAGGCPGSAGPVPAVGLLAIYPASTSPYVTYPQMLPETCADIAINNPGAFGTNALSCNSANTSGSSSGTVSSFSSGSLSPLFTTSVATPTTTPALSFSLSNAAGYSWFGNAASGSGAPSYNTAPLPILMGGTGTTTPSLVEGTNVTITGSWPNQTINSTASGGGSVTSVGLSLPGGFSVSGSPVTTSGTLAATFAAVNCSTGEFVSGLTSSVGLTCGTPSGGTATTAQQAQVQAGPIQVPNSGTSLGGPTVCDNGGASASAPNCTINHAVSLGEMWNVFISGVDGGGSTCALNDSLGNTWTKKGTYSNGILFYDNSLTAAGTDILQPDSNCTAFYPDVKVVAWQVLNSSGIGTPFGWADANCSHGTVGAPGSGICSETVTTDYASSLVLHIAMNPAKTDVTGISTFPNGVVVYPLTNGYALKMDATGFPQSGSQTIGSYFTYSANDAGYERGVDIPYEPNATAYVAQQGTPATSSGGTLASASIGTVTSGKTYILYFNGGNTCTETITSLSDGGSGTFTLLPNNSGVCRIYKYVPAASGATTITWTISSGNVYSMAAYALTGVTNPVLSAGATVGPNDVLLVLGGASGANTLTITPTLQDLGNSTSAPAYDAQAIVVPVAGPTPALSVSWSTGGNNTNYVLLQLSSPITGPVFARQESCSDHGPACTGAVGSTTATETFDGSKFNAFTRTLSQNITTSYYQGMKNGRAYPFTICQPASGGPFTFAWPSNSVNPVTISSTASACTAVVGTWIAAAQEMVFSQTNILAGTGIGVSGNGNNVIITNTAAAGASNYVNLCSSVTLSGATCSGGIITPSGTATSFTVSGIPGTYLNLRIEAYTAENISSGGADLLVQFNSDSAADYVWTHFSAQGATTGGGSGGPDTALHAGVVGPGGTTSRAAGGTINIPLYSQTDNTKFVNARFLTYDNAIPYTQWYTGAWKSLSAITSITFTTGNSLDWTTAAHFTLYGTN